MALRMVQVGMGTWGRDWARLLSRTTALVETVGCVDVEPGMLQQLQTDVGISA